MPPLRSSVIILFLQIIFIANTAGQQKALFRVLSFYTAKNDPAHISFVHEANRWLAQQAATHHFQYDSTNDWSP